MKLHRHPLSKPTPREISTFALIERSIAGANLAKLEGIELQLETALKSGALEHHAPTRSAARSALIKVRKAIAKQKADDLFDLPKVSLAPAVIQHLPLS
jgi:hypothetical protein